MPDFFAGLQWERPFFLLLALLPFVTKFIGVRPFSAKQLKKRYKGIVELHLLPYMLVHPKNSRLSALISFFAWLLAAVALAGPNLKQTSTTENKNPPVRHIAVIVDISRSMLTQDTLPNRLTRAKKELQELVSQLPHDRFALIAYAANAYLVTPFTDDHDAFLQFAESLSPTLTQRQGSNLIQALELARKITPLGGHTVLLTDGGIQSIPSDALKAAQRLANNNIRLLVLGLGTEIGGPVVNPQGETLFINGKAAQSRLNTPFLRTLSSRTEGAYSDLTPDSSDWKTLLTVLRPANANNTLQKYSLQHDLPLFPWFLALSLICFLILASQGRPLLPVFVLIVLVLPAPPLQASPFNNYYERQGWQALQQKKTMTAEQFYKKTDSYTGVLGLGVSHYRQKQWTNAATAFTKALNKAQNPTAIATARYNLGNAQAQLEQYSKAQHNYQQVLRLQPQHKRAILNLNQVNQRLQKLHFRSQSEQPKKNKKDTSSNNISEVSGRDIQDKQGTTIEIPLSGTINDGASRAVQVPSAHEDIEPLLHYRFNQQDERKQPLLTSNPW